MERDRAKRGSDATPGSRTPRRYLSSFYLLGFTMNQFGATLLIVETLFIQTVNGPGTGEGEGSNIRRRMCVRARARCRTRIGESAYFRVYIPPIQEFITLDSTLTEIYRIRNRLEGRREYQAFRFGGSSSSRTT